MKSLSLVLAAGMVLTASRSFAQDAAAPTDGPYKILQKVNVGGTGGADYVFADSIGRRLYLARSGGRGGRGGGGGGGAGANASKVTVFDLDTLKPVGEIPNTNGVHGAVVDPVSGNGFSSSNPVVMFDTKTLETKKTIHCDGNPDGYLFEPFTESIYILSHSAPNVTVIDGKDGTIKGTIDLGGAPEQGASDGKGHVYISVEDKDNIAVVDAKAMTVTAHYDLQGKGGGPAGMGLDAQNGIIFSYCHTPAVCVVMSAADGKILDTLPTGTGVDAGEFNANTMESFSSNGQTGNLTVIKENSPTSFAVEQNLKTLPGFKCSTLDSKTDHILIIGAEYGPVPAPATQPAAAPAPGGDAAPADRGGRGGGRGGRGRGGPRGPMIAFDVMVVGK
jgi:hypothetical protein